MAVLVVANPKAKLFRRRPALIRRLEKSAGGQTRFSAPEDVHGLRDELRRGLRDGVHTLAIAGGDGTAAFVLTELCGIYGDAPRPKIALLRGGTMNTVARGLGFLRGDPESRLAALLDDRFTHSTRPCALLRANGRVGFLFGTGIFASFLESYYEAGRGMPGPDTAVRVLSRFVGSSIVSGPFSARVARRVPMTLHVDEAVWDQGEYLTVAAGTVPEVGLGFAPFSRTRTHGDVFELLALRASARRTATILPRVLRGAPLPETVAATLLGRRVELRSPEPFNFMVDGDLYDPVQTLTLEVAGAIEAVQIAGIDLPR